MQNQSTSILFRAKPVTTVDIVMYSVLSLILIFTDLPLIVKILTPLLFFGGALITGNRIENVEIFDKKIKVGVRASKFSTSSAIEIEKINEIKISIFRILLIGHDLERNRVEKVVIFKSVFSREKQDEIVRTLLAMNPNIKI